MNRYYHIATDRRCGIFTTDIPLTNGERLALYFARRAGTEPWFRAWPFERHLQQAAAPGRVRVRG